MVAFIKTAAAFKTAAQLNVLSYSRCLDASEQEASTVTVAGTDVSRSNAGNWLYIDRELYLIDKVTPQEGRTLLSLLPPEDAFSRLLPYTAPSSGTTIGGFISAILNSNWIAQADGAYAYTYLSVTATDSAAFIAPALDDDGLWALTDYIRAVRSSASVRVDFSVQRDTLSVSIHVAPTTARKILFDDGHAQLETAAYSRSGTAKITVVQPVDSGTTDADGEKIYNTTYTDWYLAADGSSSTSVPAQRADGQWITLALSASAVQSEKVADQFGRNKASHKVEFWSDRLYSAYDPCTLLVYGELLSSYISYVGLRSTDSRYFYRSGELATTAAEKLKGVSS